MATAQQRPSTSGGIARMLSTLILLQHDHQRSGLPCFHGQTSACEGDFWAMKLLRCHQQTPQRAHENKKWKVSCKRDEVPLQTKGHGSTIPVRKWPSFRTQNWASTGF